MSKKTVLALTFLCLALGAGLGQAQDSPEFRVIVHASNPVSSLARIEASRLFLKRVTRWENGHKVLPVDQVEKSAVRPIFSLEIHHKDVDWIKSYWQRLFFSGRATAPPELTSDEEVLSYIRSNVDAIGYVSGKASLGEGVKAIEIAE